MNANQLGKQEALHFYFILIESLESFVNGAIPLAANGEEGNRRHERTHKMHSHVEIYKRELIKVTTTCLWQRECGENLNRQLQRLHQSPSNL